MRRLCIVLASALALGPLGPAALSQTGMNPVVNSGFELTTDNPASDQLEGSALDECIGVGHQVFYGEDTWQHDLIDDGDPVAAGDRIAADPEGEAEFFAGYGHCVFSDEEGFDLAWLNPVQLSKDEAVHWSGHGDDLVGDLDGDGDREIGVSGDGGPHNFWQAWPSPFQAFTGNFDALEFDLEAGSIPSNASVKVSLSATPLGRQTPRLVLFLDCDLTFRGSELAARAGADGHVTMDPTEALFRARTNHSDDCVDLQQEWDTAESDDERRAILGRTRIVQLSFWGFERGDEDDACGCTAQIDDVSLTDATSVVQEVAQGNLKANPDPTLD